MRLAANLVDLGAAEINTPQNEEMLSKLFERYCDQITPGNFLTKPVTPFSSHLFDVSAIERIFTYVPQIVRSLTERNAEFSFDQFLSGRIISVFSMKILTLTRWSIRRQKSCKRRIMGHLPSPLGESDWRLT